VGEAGTGREAIAAARLLRPDVMTMDVVMPGLDGLSAIEEIMSIAPTRIIVISQLAATEQDLAFRALAVGALELIAKPTTLVPTDLPRWGSRVARTIRLMREVPVITRRCARSPSTAALASAPDDMALGPIDALGIAASTGGPQVIARVLKDLPADLPIPIFIAQHIAEGFTEGMRRWLAEASRLQVSIAGGGEPAQPGQVYLPPAGFSLVMDAARAVRLQPCSGALCPSGDITLSSLAKVLKRRAGGLVLSGMGTDGARGLLEIHHAGGLTLAQDEQSCAVYGMPHAALLAGAVQRISLPDEMAPLIVRAARRRRPPGPTPGGLEPAEDQTLY
jgi:two-component system chemotaxis response regulator CheB